MDRQQIIQIARHLVESQSKAFVMATVSPEGKPHVFYMGAALLEEPFTLYMEAYADSAKMQHIRENPNVEIVLSEPDYSEVVTISGVASVDESPQKKRQLWESISASSRYFSSPEDPTFGVIKMVAKELKLQTMAQGPRKMEVVRLPD